MKSITAEISAKRCSMIKGLIWVGQWGRGRICYLRLSCFSWQCCMWQWNVSDAVVASSSSSVWWCVGFDGQWHSHSTSRHRRTFHLSSNVHSAC